MNCVYNTFESDDRVYRIKAVGYTALTADLNACQHFKNLEDLPIGKHTAKGLCYVVNDKPIYIEALLDIIVEAK